MSRSPQRRSSSSIRIDDQPIADLQLVGQSSGYSADGYSDAEYER